MIMRALMIGALKISTWKIKFGSAKQKTALRRFFDGAEIKLSERLRRSCPFRCPRSQTLRHRLHGVP